LPNSRINLANIRSSLFTVGIILSYKSLGLSLRQIESVLNDIYGLPISHQSIKNYIDAAASRLSNLVLNFPYHISNILAADETYIHLLKKFGYLTFCFDPVNQIIPSFNISYNRNFLSLAKAVVHAVFKFPLNLISEKSPNNPLFITDGNPVYKIIVQFLRQTNIFLSHKVVIGIKNLDPESKNFRNIKQIIERLNKIWSKFMNNSEYFGSINGASSNAVIFVAYFNFLRKNSNLNNQIPVPIPQVLKGNLLPDRWIKLIHFASNFI
jgi:hypothetical protein